MTDRFLVIDDLRTLRADVVAQWQDDQGQPPEIVYARNSVDGMERLSDPEATGYTIIHLDHDLGGDDTIMPCVDYITEHSDKFSEVSFYVHTSNPYAGDQMVRQLATEGLFVVRVQASEFLVVDYNLL